MNAMSLLKIGGSGVVVEVVDFLGRSFGATGQYEYLCFILQNGTGTWAGSIVIRCSRPTTIVELITGDGSRGAEARIIRSAPCGLVRRSGRRFFERQSKKLIYVGFQALAMSLSSRRLVFRLQVELIQNGL